MTRNLFDAQSQIDDTMVHKDPNEEMTFCLQVANGDVEKVEQNCREGKFYRPEEGFGLLSSNPITNLKYHCVISIALVTRFCCEAGMETEYAYRLSDFYIRQLDSCSTDREIGKIHDTAVLDFARKMRMNKQTVATSQPINKALDYIYTNIRDRLTIDEVADELGLSKNYLSRLFKSEIGIPFSDYVREEKIKKAKNLLRHTDYSLIDIANYLSFSSQSHFTQVFKKTTGVTPKAFRDELYQTTWKTHSKSGHYEIAPAPA